MGGTGFSASWQVQNGNTTVPGYQSASGNLGFSDLQSFGNHAAGGNAYLTAGRMLNTDLSGPFASYIDNGNIGQPGTSLFLSALLRKENDNDQAAYFAFHQTSVAWFIGGTSSAWIGLGYFGTNSNNSGTRYWTLRVGSDFYQTSVPVSVGTAAFMVAEIQFGSNDTHTINVWINPSSLGAVTPTPTLSQTVNHSLALNAIGYYGGNGVGESSIDEIRFAETYQCAAPGAATSINQLPTASFSASGTTGQAPFVVSFDGGASNDPDGNISQYLWQFGDGGTSSSVSPTYTFEHVGVMQVVLTVTDDCGSQSGKEMTIMVQGSDGQTPCGTALSLTNLVNQGADDGAFSISSEHGNIFSLTDGVSNYAPTGNTFQNLPVGQYTLSVAGSNGCSESFDLTMPLDNQSVSSWTPDLCDMQMGMNVDGAPYWNQVRPFKDIKKTSSEFFTGDVASGGPWNTNTIDEVPVDAQGYPLEMPYATSEGLQLVRCIISADGSMLLDDYVLLYDGEGSISMYGNAAITSSQAGRIEFTVAGTGNIWFHIDQSTSGNHLRNIRIVRASQESSLLTEPFNEVFLDKLNAFTTIRFMDWGHTNNSESVFWNDRKQSNYHTQGHGSGIAYEYMIDLANRLQKDVWVCVPHQADDNYIASMAALFKAGLDSNLNIYIEYSNEVWNWQFQQAHWVYNNGPAHLVHPRQYAERCRKVFESWHSVFAGETERVKRVLATQAVNPWLGEQAMAQLHGEFDFLSPTWYFGYSGGACETGLHAGSSGQDVIDCAMENWRTVTGPMRQHYNNARMYGKGVIEYEGGQHMTSNPVSVPFQQAVYDGQLSPGIKLAYNEVLDSLRNWGSSLAVAFTLASVRESIYGSWGALEFIEQDPASQYAPKWEVLNENIHCYTPPVSIVLPVEINEFIVEERDCVPLVYWQTEFEENSAVFEVQRSTNGREFSTVGELAAAGYSQVIQEYKYHDKTAPLGQLFYRLKQVDSDGTFTFSPVKSLTLECSDDFDFSVSPNPAESYFELRVEQDLAEGKLLLRDIKGEIIRKVLMSNLKEGDSVTLDCQAIPAGVYFIELLGDSQMSRTKRLVIME